MRKQIFAALAAVALVAALAGPAAAAADQSDLYWFSNGDEVGNGAHTTLKRAKSTVNANVRGLAGGHAITLWAVVFEHPENCSGDCGGDDVDAAFGGDTSVDITITYAAGGVSNNGGNLNLNGTIGGGQTLLGDGTLDNNAGAEVHFVVRSHGPDQPGNADTTSVSGGCTVGLADGAIPSAVGECSDIQFSVHTA